MLRSWHTPVGWRRAGPAQPHNQFLGLVQGWISLGAGVVLNGSWMTFPAGNSARLPEQWEHWGPGHAVGKSRQGPGSAVPGPPFPTNPHSPTEGSAPVASHLSLAGGAALWKGGGLGAHPEAGMGLMGWVQAWDEPGHTAPPWHRASAHKNWIPPCSSPLP